MQIAADAAEGVSGAFCRQETTVAVVRYAPLFNALFLMIGSQVGRPGCWLSAPKKDRTRNLVCVASCLCWDHLCLWYRRVFTDGDDTPWSKAFWLQPMPRGLKTLHFWWSRCRWDEVEGKSMFHSARCLCVTKAAGVHLWMDQLAVSVFQQLVPKWYSRSLLKT